MEISRRIPARTKTILFSWAYKNFTKCDQKYREIRKRRGSMLKCDWCGHEFEDGEMIGLAQPKPKQEGPKRNWALCDKCYDSLDQAARKP